MRWNSRQFMQALDDTVLNVNRYENENRWFSKDSWGDYSAYTMNAWRLYRAAYDTHLGMLILGSAKIRSDPTLVGNFGVTSAGGLEKEEDLQLLKLLEDKRSAQRKAPALSDAPKVLGQGSILNDKNWTPLLNDAFIIGGMHAGHEFHVAEDAAHQHLRMLEQRQARGGRSSSDAEKWADFFKTHSDILWMSTAGVPRIFARELVGLSTFGYAPEFKPQQLSFRCADRDKAGRASFVGYLDAVEAAGFRSGSSRSVLGALSKFLFGRADALTGAGA
jgi:hypothetical protein